MYNVLKDTIWSVGSILTVGLVFVGVVIVWTTLVVFTARSLKETNWKFWLFVSIGLAMLVAAIIISVIAP